NDVGRKRLQFIERGRSHAPQPFSYLLPGLAVPSPAALQPPRGSAGVTTGLSVTQTNPGCPNLEHRAANYADGADAASSLGACRDNRHREQSQLPGSTPGVACLTVIRITLASRFRRLTS